MRPVRTPPSLHAPHLAEHGPQQAAAAPVMETDASMLHAFLYDSRSCKEWRPEGLHGLRDLTSGGHVLWVNVNGVASPGLMKALESEFGMHPLTLEDIQHAEQRPKVEEYGGYLYVVVRMLKEDAEEGLDSEQVSVLLGDGWVLTLQEGKPGDVFEPLREALRAGRPQIRSRGADYLLYSILDAVVDAFFPILDKVAEQAEALEEDVLEGAEANPREKLQDLRRDLRTIRQVAQPQRDALASLERNEPEWIRPATRTFMRDVSDHATRVVDAVEANRDLVASLMDLHLGNMTQRTNEAMRVLTVVATIFIPLTFIAGVYGMNFDHMPELRSPWGYPVAMAFMAALGIGMYVAFRRRGWV